MVWLLKCYLSILTTISLIANNGMAAEFKKKEIQLGNKKITVELAESPEQQEQGLMFRKNLNKDTGMLFVFSNPQVLSFWMKNTLIDLTIGYFDEKGILFQTIDMKALRTNSRRVPPTYVSKKEAKYALEMSMGWYQQNKIKIGTQLKGL